MALSVSAIARTAIVLLDGTARIFRLMNELAIAAIETVAEEITDEAVSAWKPSIEAEAAFA